MNIKTVGFQLIEGLTVKESGSGQFMIKRLIKNWKSMVLKLNKNKIQGVYIF
jgi:hypothetical protein